MIELGEVVEVLNDTVRVDVGGTLYNCDLLAPYGIITKPTVGDTIALSITDSGTGERVAVAVYLEESDLHNINPGESMVKAKGGGSMVCRTWGDLELNGSGRTLVTHAELQAALNTFVTSINAAFTTKLDGGGSSPVLSIDISSANAPTLKTGN